MNINTLTAHRIKEIRSQLGVTSQSVADELDITISSYSALENGKVSITIERLYQIAQIFNVPLSRIIPGMDTNQTINVSHGTHAVNATTYNNYQDKDIIATLSETMQMIQIVLSKLK